MARADRIMLAVAYGLLVAVVAWLSWLIQTGLDQARADRCTMFEVQVAVSLSGLIHAAGTEPDPAAADALRTALAGILAPLEQSCPELSGP